jgi:hypothetical protein
MKKSFSCSPGWPSRSTALASGTEAINTSWSGSGYTEGGQPFASRHHAQ